MATYNQLVQRVRDWSNRDADVLSSANIKTFINFAADNVYRDLRIAPLEFTYVYPTQVIAADDTEVYNTLSIPADTIEFIQLRKRDTNSTTGYTVYAAKSDIRSFYQQYTTKYDECYYTRERNKLVVHPALKDGDQFELFYYRRLPEQDARWDATIANDAFDGLYSAATRAALITQVQNEEGSDVFTNDPDLMGRIYVEDSARTTVDSEVIAVSDIDTDTNTVVLSQDAGGIASVNFNGHDTENWTFDSDAPRDVVFGFSIDTDDVIKVDYYTDLEGGAYLGKLVPNWLRDSNEKLILFGALAEAFTFLDEPQQAQKYMQRFDQELQNLNQEENNRKYMGGNVQLHYQSFLI